MPEQLRHAALQLVRRRILALLLVADFGCRHRGEHPGRGLRDGVGAKVDHECRRYRKPDGPDSPRADAARARRARVPRATGVGVDGARRRRLRRDDEPAARAPRRARRRRALLHAHRRDGARVEGRHDQDALPHRRRPSGRGGAHALPRRPALALPLVAVGLPAHVHVLRDGLDGVRAEPHRVGDPRPGAPLPPRDRGESRRLHGDGRADAQPRRGARRGATAAGRRDHAPPHDDLHRRLAPRPDALRRRGGRGRSASRSRSTRPTTSCDRGSCP